MEGRFNVLVIMIVALSALVQTSVAQKRYVVGGASGWTIPSTGSAAYTNWATDKTFKVGDTLVFNFPTGVHNVAEVTKAAYDACATSNPISLLSNGPASIVLNKTGVHYYICAVGNHCSLGQKLTVTVSSAASPAPAPQPSATPKTAPVAAPSLAPAPISPPAPASAPAAAPSRGPVTYRVGDKLGWTIPSSNSAYQTWASGKTFSVGDILVFNFPNGTHNVAEVTKANYDSCGTKSTLSLFTKPPVRVTLSKPGEHFFICTFPGHCAAAQKLSIHVTASNSASTPTPLAPSPSSATAPSPSTTSNGVAPSPSTTSTTPSTPSPAGATPSTTSSSPSPAGATTPQNSAESVRVAGLFSTLLTLAVAFLC